MFDLIQMTNREVLIIVSCFFVLGVTLGVLAMTHYKVKLDSMKRTVDMGLTFTDEDGRIWTAGKMAGRTTTVKSSVAMKKAIERSRW